MMAKVKITLLEVVRGEMEGLLLSFWCTFNLNSEFKPPYYSFFIHTFDKL